MLDVHFSKQQSLFCVAQQNVTIESLAIVLCTRFDFRILRYQQGVKHLAFTSQNRDCGSI